MVILCNDVSELPLSWQRVRSTAKVQKRKSKKNVHMKKKSRKREDEERGAGRHEATKKKTQKNKKKFHAKKIQKRKDEERGRKAGGQGQVREEEEATAAPSAIAASPTFTFKEDMWLEKIANKRGEYRTSGEVWCRRRSATLIASSTC